MIRFHPYARKTEARVRSAQDLPGKAVFGPHARARRPPRDRSPLRRRPVRRPHARRRTAPLGPAPRDGRCAPVVGRPEGPLTQPCRQAARGPCGRPPARIRRLRGDHPRRQLWRGGGDRMGPRALGAARGPPRRDAEGEAAVRAARLQAKGKWTLVKLKKGEKEWLLIK